MYQRAHNLIGQIFGSLTVIERVLKPKHVQVSRASYWLCVCSCGTKHIVRSDSLLSGRITRCQKCKYKAVSNDHKVDLVGKVFHRLTVVGVAGKTSNRQTLWLCKCECGKDVIVRTDGLKTGTTKSCGCWNKDRLRDKMIADRLLTGIGQSSKSATMFLDMLEQQLKKQIEREVLIEHRFFDGNVGKALIEVDGDYWHHTVKQKDIDKHKNKIAKQHGYTLFRFVVNNTDEVLKRLAYYQQDVCKLKEAI